MANFTHDGRLLFLTTPLGKDAVLVNGFKGREAISLLTELTLDLLSLPERPIDPPSLIGKRITLGINHGNDPPRYFNGIVRSLELVSHDAQLEANEKVVLVYKAEVVPSLWLLTLNTQTRVFQNKTVIEIAKVVLGSYSITPVDNTKATYQPLDYCTQYRESDYSFLTRLLEQHGIFFFFTHTQNDHILVLADDSAQLAPCPEKSTFDYLPETDREGGDFQGMYVYQFAVRSALVTGKHTLWEYRFTQFARQASSHASSSRANTGDNNHEWYDYADGPSAWAKTDNSDGKIQAFQSQLQDVARDRSDSGSVEVTGESHVSRLLAGFAFQMTRHPDPALNAKYLVTSVEHSARQQPPFRGDSIGVEGPYRNIFTAQPGSLAYRPMRITPKPRVHGVVTGKVVVPAGEDSYVDKYGRVCVQFWWDRTRPPNQVDNTMLRVVQAWAGSGWGTYFWPRIGDEVLIDFIEGDPDSPIVVGSLYNGVNKPKYNPATEYTRSGVLTRSSKNGSAANANELRFEDKIGSEQIFINAERDMDHRIEVDHRRFVGGKDSLIVKGGQYDEIAGDRHSNIGANRIEKIAASADLDIGTELTERVGQNYSLDIGQSYGKRVGTNYSLDVGEEVYIKSGTKLVIESGTEICLKGLGGFITIGPTGVAISGIMVLINSGGVPSSGSPVEIGSPETPTAPDEADDGTRGGKM
ncbi:type VI secretion system tip protein TssI/VgrG [Granulicella sp. dw_53]|uniref:type VI secretion system Vgr family protein n=1 Tax=Granulicella sp. dw_53 TaxID=2719792 RepID=UPI001BD28D05|nr:type VI secretion system tip protein TssI/VgrG [Granulicella sp. dw_53]